MPGIDLSTLQIDLEPWVAHNFGERPSWQPLLGLQEELGELSHAYLKRAQGIRTNEDHNAGIRDAVADLVIFLADFCNAEGIDLEREVALTWAKVSQRDWKKNPTGTT
jgi:NTP pyrophosphatase (non-canonical NTP hydrolase)